MSELALPAVPSKLRRLKEWALGDGLAAWSEAFQPGVTSAADRILESLTTAICETQRQLNDFHEVMKLEVIPGEDQVAEEQRLLNNLDKQIDMLGKLSGIHNKLTSVGVAAMVAALTRPSIKDLPGDNESFKANTTRDVTPRRTLGQA